MTSGKLSEEKQKTLQAFKNCISILPLSRQKAGREHIAALEESFIASDKLINFLKGPWQWFLPWVFVLQYRSTKAFNKLMRSNFLAKE